MDSTPEQRHIRYWRRVTCLTRLLLLVWFLVTFTVIYFARELSRITVLGWPLSFYMAAQGIVIIYLAIVGLHVWVMRKLDKNLLDGSPHGK